LTFDRQPLADQPGVASVALCALGIAGIVVAAEWLLARGGRRR
jgi:hypothetical protein